MIHFVVLCVVSGWLDVFDNCLFVVQIRRREEEMKKGNSANLTRPTNIRKLLEELKNIERQSTENQINLLIERQKQSGRGIREINTEINRRNHRQLTLQHTKTDKENHQLHPSLAAGTTRIQLSSNNRRTPTNCKTTLATERYPNKTKPYLPSLSSKTSKRNSIEEPSPKPQSPSVLAMLLNKAGSECDDLQVIEQQALDPLQSLEGLASSKLQKQRSWAYSNTTD